MTLSSGATATLYDVINFTFFFYFVGARFFLHERKCDYITMMKKYIFWMGMQTLFMAVVCCIMIVPVFVHKIHSLNPNEQRWLLCHISGKKKNVHERVDKVAFLKWQSLEFVWWRKNEAQQHFASRHIAFYMWLCSVHTVHTQWPLSMAWKLKGAKKARNHQAFCHAQLEKHFDTILLKWATLRMGWKSASHS